MVGSGTDGAGGFTILEALIATLLSTVVAILVTSTFIVQNEFYSDTASQTVLQETVRGATARVSMELGAVPEGGILVAEADRIAYRAPILIGGVCGVGNGETFVYFPVVEADMAASEVKGYGLRHASSPWRFTTARWSEIRRSSGSVAARACALAGADTTGAVDSFYGLTDLGSPGAVEIGDLVMLFREMEIELASSGLRRGSRAVFLGPFGGSVNEFASGLSDDSGFLYQLSGEGGFQDRVTGNGNLARIEKVRFFFDGLAPAARGDRDSLSFDLNRTVSLRDVR